MCSTTFNTCNMVRRIKGIKTTNTKTKAILCDERALQIYDTYYAIESQRNAKGKFTNHFLSTEKIFSWSNLVNIAVFNIE